MHIVILGAGDIGFHIAGVLSRQQCDVTLLDCNHQRLINASHRLDIAVRQGEGTCWKTLKELLRKGPNFFLAVTESDEMNFVSCTIAKKVGYRETIARVRKKNYLSRGEVDFRQIFPVNHLIGPELSVAYDIQQHILANEARNVQTFAHGRVQMRTLTISEKWDKQHIPLKHLDLPKGVKISFIRRSLSSDESIFLFPHGNDALQAGDEVTVIGKSRVILDIHQFFGTAPKKMRSVILIGGSIIAAHLAELLIRQGVSVKIVEKNYERCCALAEYFPRAVIIHGDGTDSDLLQSEGMEYTDVVVSCMNSDSKNVLVALLAKELQAKEIVVSIANVEYMELLRKSHIHHVLSPRVSVANQVLSIIRGKSILSVASLYEEEAEILEVKMSPRSQLINIPLEVLGPQFPEQLLVGVILSSQGEVIVPDGKQVFSLGDRVVLFTHPKHVDYIRNNF